MILSLCIYSSLSLIFEWSNGFIRGGLCAMSAYLVDINEISNQYVFIVKQIYKINI